MNNFSIEINGHTFWISRSVAVVGFVYGYIEEHEYILAVQRGTGTPDPEFVDCWCLPCGYLDYDETIEEALKREVFEETGVLLDENTIDLLEVNSNPKSDKRQNVTFRYQAITKENDLANILLTTENSEKDEVSDVKWIPIDEIDNYKWAFNHKELIKKYN